MNGPATSNKWARRVLALVVCLLLVAAVACGVFEWRLRRELREAQRLSELGLPSEARSHLKRFLAWHPSNPDACLLMARTLSSDDTLTEEASLLEAIAYLHTARHSSNHHVSARHDEAHIRFLLMGSPYQAEPLLRDVARAADKRIESQYLLWKLLDMTARAELSEPHFWRCFELTPPAGRLNVLRAWYLSQFSPRTATLELDRRLGVLAPEELPTELSDVRRLRWFRDRMPGSEVGQWALVRFVLLSGHRPLARELMQEIPEPARYSREPFCLATRLQLLFDLGEFDAVSKEFAEWPEPHIGHEYWKWRGHVMDEVMHRDAEARDAYGEAIKLWPGPIDWKLHFRLEKVLVRLGDAPQAEAAKARAETVAHQMEQSVHTRLRSQLQLTPAPDAVEELARFYDAIQRPEEAAWRDCVPLPQRP